MEWRGAEDLPAHGVRVPRVDQDVRLVRRVGEDRRGEDEYQLLPTLEPLS